MVKMDIKVEWQFKIKPLKVLLFCRLDTVLYTQYSVESQSSASYATPVTG